jgi:hypothetical protein
VVVTTPAEVVEVGLVMTWMTDMICDEGLTMVLAGVDLVRVTTLPVCGCFDGCVDGLASEVPVTTVKVSIKTPGTVVSEFDRVVTTTGVADGMLDEVGAVLVVLGGSVMTVVL